MSSKVDLLERYGLDLEGAVRNLIDKGNWRDLLDLSARFKSYSTTNLLLLFSQACNRGFSPSIVAGYRSWQRLGRQVKKGEKALFIFAPNIKKVGVGLDLDSNGELNEVVVGYRLVSVFDVSQTTGDELPQPPEPLLLDVESFAILDLIEELTEFLAIQGFEVAFEPLDAVNGFTDFENKLVKVRSDVSSSQRLKTLVHETAHAILHNEGIISRAQAELEAESCAYVVCRALGIDSSSYSFPYVARWSDGDVELVNRVARSVHRCAGKILECLESWENAIRC